MTWLAPEQPEYVQTAPLLKPPVLTRAAFWLLNCRVGGPFRPWAAAQLAWPSYFRPVCCVPLSGRRDRDAATDGPMSTALS